MLKGVTGDQLYRLQQGDWTWLVPGLPPPSIESLQPPKLIRSWPDKDGNSNVLLVVKPSQKSQFTKQGKLAKVVWAPYLSPGDLELRRQRTEIFRTLQEEGYKPKWHGKAGIRYFRDGKAVDYSFD